MSSLSKKIAVGAVLALLVVGVPAAFANSKSGGVMPRGGMHGEMHRGLGGKITAINGTTLTLSAGKDAATTVTVDATNATIKLDGVASTFSTLAVGDIVMVKPVKPSTPVAQDAAAKTAKTLPTSIVAQEVNKVTKMMDMMDDMGRHDNHGMVFGKITAVNGATLTMTGRDNKTFTVNAANVTTVKIDGKDSALSSLVVGDMIAVKGTPDAADATKITATAITKGPMVTLKGKIENLKGKNLRLRNKMDMMKSGMMDSKNNSSKVQK